MEIGLMVKLTLVHWGSLVCSSSPRKFFDEEHISWCCFNCGDGLGNSFGQRQDLMVTTKHRINMIYDLWQKWSWKCMIPSGLLFTLSLTIVRMSATCCLWPLSCNSLKDRDILTHLFLRYYKEYWDFEMVR